MEMNFFVVLLPFLSISLVESGFIYGSSLGNDCLYDEDCITRNSFCKGNKICACKIGYQYDPGSDVCFPKEVDLKCKEDYDCSALENTRCTQGICKCKNDYVSSYDKSTCLPSMRLTSTCKEDSQCNSVLNGSLCDHSISECVCAKGFRKHPHRMQCIQRQQLHTICLTTEDCEWEEENKGKVECRPLRLMVSACECREGFIEKNDVCISGSSSSPILSHWISVFFMVKWIHSL